jgi:hypothetical protein
MKTLLRVGAAVVLLVTSAWAQSNLNLSKSNINRLSRGTLVTASTSVSATAGQFLYRTPAAGDFVLTQVCAGSTTVSDYFVFQIGGVSIAQVGSGVCQTFSPGLILTPDQPLTCGSSDIFSRGSFCTITGIQEPASPPTPTPRS